MTFLCNCKIICRRDDGIGCIFIKSNIVVIEGFEHAKWDMKYGNQRIISILCSDSYLDISDETWVINFDTKEVTRTTDSINKPIGIEKYTFVKLVMY